MDNYTIDSEFFRPLTNGWLSKLESAARSRKDWKDTADECMMFYANSAKAMWDPQISKKFWRGTKLPRFRVTINKAFEMVAIFGPNLFWDVPHRTVEGKRPMNLPPEFFMGDPQLQMMGQQLMQSQQSRELEDKIISFLMDRWLNYTPREQPGGGLSGHSQRAMLDALIKGRGATAIRPYKMPGSGRNLTGGFRVAPENIFLDPDFDSVDECRWMAIKHIDVHTDVEKRFQLPANSLKNKSTLESSFTFGELSTDDQSSAHRKNGQTNDLVIWYEIYSKSGVGCSHTTMDPTMREHLTETVGQYAYIAICGDVPYPLNMSAEKLRKGASDEEVKEAFSWPVPFYADDKWPVEFLDFYTNPESAWPVAPLAPGLGELKLLNFLMSWFTNRVWSSSRDFWAVAMPYIDHYKDYLNNGEDQSIIPTPVGLKSPKEAIEILTQPETRQDMTQLIGFVSDMFDRRVGLTATIYGQNENNTQNRTAEETSSKQRAVMARPEYMQKQVVDWQSRIAQSEAFLTRWFVTAQDVMPLLGEAGAALWSRYIESTDIELVARQFNYTIAASSIRRPNRDRDTANFQQVMGLFAPAMQSYAEGTGNYEPYNGMVSEWCTLHDANPESLLIPSTQPTPEEQAAQAQLQQQMQQIEMAVQQATAQKLGAEGQAIMAEVQLEQQKVQTDMQVKQAEMQVKMQGEQAKMQLEQAKLQADMQMQQIELQAKAQTEQMKMAGDQQKMQADLQMKQQEMQMGLSKLQAEIQMKAEAAQQKMGLDMKAAEQKLQIEQAKAGIDMEADSTKGNIEMMQDAASHEQEMIQDQEVHEQEMEQKEEAAKQALDTAKKTAAIAATAAKANAKNKAKPQPKPKGK